MKALSLRSLRKMGVSVSTSIAIAGADFDTLQDFLVGYVERSTQCQYEKYSDLWAVYSINSPSFFGIL